MMSEDPLTPAEGSGPLVRILEQSEDYAFGSLFRVVRAILQFRRFDGKLSEPVTRINFERGDSVAILPYDPGEDVVVLVRQFRYPVYAGLAAQDRSEGWERGAWLLEMVAGVQDTGRTVEDVAHKELFEEAGFEVRGDWNFITTIYPSPGGTSERIHLYWVEVDHTDRAGRGGGVAAEGEDIQLIILPLRDALKKVAAGEISDAKTIIALQHLAARG